MSVLAPTPSSGGRPADGERPTRSFAGRGEPVARAAGVEIGVAAALFAIIAAMTAAILSVCHGHLIYALDDPYTSLSLGRHIAQGRYGINWGEAASPSSSMLYPLLLAAFAWANWQDWLPLVVNTCAALATGILFADALRRWGVLTRPERRAWGIVLSIALCLALDTVGLVFTGLEHSLHALASVFVVLLLARTLAGERPPPTLVAAIALLPMLRFEGAALALLVIAALALAGHRRQALVALAAVAAIFGAWFAAMQALGLPPLPSSVLRKSAVATEALAGPAGLLMATLRNAFANLSGEAVPVLLLLVLVVAHPLLRGRRIAAAPHPLTLPREWLFAGVVAGALLAQIVFGRWGGGFARYEAYALAFGAAGAIVLWGPAFGALLARGGPLFKTLAVILVLVAGQISLAATMLSPLSARGIFEMHYQMRRLAVDFYRRPTAAIDIGLLGYRNPYYVLDLWGLGSEAVRQAETGGATGTAWLDHLAAAHGVGLAMVYDNFFEGRIPPDWVKLGALTAAHRPLGYNVLSFYATSPAAAPAAIAALRAFAATVGEGTGVTLLDGP